MGRDRGRWLGWGAVLLLSLFVAALSVGELLHHDFACHLKSPTHCTACASAPAASLSHTPGPGAADVQPPRGGTSSEAVATPRDHCASLTCAGRAPPSLS